MAWSPSSFQPDNPVAPADATPAAAWTPSSFAPSGGASGQAAAAEQGAKPMAPPEPVKLPPVQQANVSARFAGPNTAIDTAPPAAPGIPANEEPGLGFPTGIERAVQEGSAGRFGIAEQIAYGKEQLAKQSATTLQRRQAVQAAAPGPVDFEHGNDGVVSRFMTGLAGNSDERAKILKDGVFGMGALPKGTDVQVKDVKDVGKVLLFKLPGEDKYRTLKGTEFSAGDIGGAGATGAQIAPQIAAGMASDGLGPLARMFYQGVTAAGTELAKRTALRGADVNTDPVTSDLGGATASGVENAAAEGLASIISKGVRSAGGSDKGLLTKFAPETKAVEAEARLGAPNLTLGQIRNEPFGVRESYLNSISPVLGQHYDKQADFITKLLDTPGTLTDPALKAEIDRMQTNAVKGVANPNVPMEEGGAALKEGLFNPDKGYLPTSGKQISGLYDALDNEATNAHYDLTPLKNVIAEQRAGVPMKGKNFQESYGDYPMGSKAGDANAADVTDRGLTGIMDDLAKASENVGPYKGNSGFTQLKTLRSRLGEYVDQNFQNLDAGARADYRKARSLYGALTDIMENPTTGAGPGYKQAMGAAQSANRARESFLDMADVQAIKRGDNPADFVSMAKPGNAVPLQAIKDNIAPDKWKTYQDAFMTKLVSAPEKIEANLDKFRSDPKALNLVLDAKQQAQLRQFSTAMKDIKESVPAQLLEKFSDPTVRARGVLKMADGSKLADFVTQVGGANSPMGTEIRNGVRQAILESSLNVSKLGKQADPAKVAATLNDLLGNAVNGGKLKGILTPAEISQLQDIRTYAHSAGSGGQNTGASMASGAEAQAMFRFITRPIKALKAWADGGVVAPIQSHMFKSKTGRNFFLGAPGAKNPSPLVTTPSRAATTYLNNKENDEPNLGE